VVVERVACARAPTGATIVAAHAGGLHAGVLTYRLTRSGVDEGAQLAIDLRARHRARRERIARLRPLADAVAAIGRAVDVEVGERRVAASRAAAVVRRAAAPEGRSRALRVTRRGRPRVVRALAGGGYAHGSRHAHRRRVACLAGGHVDGAITAA